MAGSILQIIAALAGLVGAWALWKFVLKKHFQAWQTKSDTANNERDNADQAKRVDENNADDKKRQSTREDDWEKLEK